MKKALVIGATGGIGSAICSELAARGHVVTGLSRRDGLDVTDADSVARTLGAQDDVFDVIIIATGVLGTPEKSLSAITLPALQKVFAVNTFGPALILGHVGRLLAKDGVVAVLSARVGSIGDNKIGGWHSYRASKAALNQIIRGAAIELARTHKGSVVVALHPGTVETPFTAQYAGRHKTVPADAAAQNMLNVLADLTSQHTGAFFDYAGESIAW